MGGFDKNIKVIVPLLYWLFVIAFVIIFVRAFILKTSDKAVFDMLNDTRLVQERVFDAPRGNIYSYDNTTGELRLLVSNEERFDIYLDLGRGRVNAKGAKQKIDWVVSQKLWTEDLDSLSVLLADRFKDRNKAQWKQYLTENRKKENRGTLIAKMATREDLDTLRHFRMIRNAVAFEKKYKRVYPYGDMARRTIGIEYIDNGELKRNGIEGFFDSVLQGSKGKRWERNIAPGLWIPIDDTLTIKPQNSKDIITTIDIPLQELAETALKKCLDSNDAKEGCVILMETKTGYIKAIASMERVTSKEGQEEKGTYKEYKNIAVGSTFEPGSTFKTVTTMMLLDKGLCDTSELVPTGMKEFAGATRPIYDVNKRGRDNDVSLTRAMEISSNVGISDLVYKYYGQNVKTREQFAEDLQRYFVYRKLDCGIAVKEPAPRIGSSKYVDDLLRMSFGYVTSITPLQLLTFYNAIANNGVMVKPIFVSSVIQNGNIVEEIRCDTLKRKICKDETLKKVQDILRRVVLYGTGRRLKSASYGIAGKSGTAEVNYAKGNVDSKYRMHRASFVGYFPADNPQYSCIVVISEPKGGVTHGGDLAAPVFREISDRVMGVIAKKTTAISENKTDNASLTTANANNNKINRFIDRKSQINSALLSGVVPDVRGWNLADAVFVLEKLGFKVSFSGYGNVKEQSIKPKTKIEKGKTIKLTLTRK
ncbi:MAG: transpeptidase family protein [Bacteroidales bacterium]|nr:transpeptidase family protein [Bacteroidales bacterium]